jgi:hypothetical protein
MDELSAPAVYAVTAAAIPDQRALRDPAGACIADQRQDLDNAGFAGTVTAVAAVFAAAGLGRDGVLAVMMPNRVELVTSMLAAWRLGASVHRRAVPGGQFLGDGRAGPAHLLLSGPHHLCAAGVPAWRTAGHPEPALCHLRGRADAAPADRRVRGEVRRSGSGRPRAVRMHGGLHGQSAARRPQGGQRRSAAARHRSALSSGPTSCCPPGRPATWSSAGRTSCAATWAGPMRRRTSCAAAGCTLVTSAAGIAFAATITGSGLREGAGEQPLPH